MSGFSPLLFRLYASDLSQAIARLARERQMGIAQLREHFGADLTMQMGEGGKTEVYTLGDKTAQVPAGSSAAQIAAALNVQKINQIAGPSMTDPLPTVTIAPAPAPVAPTRPATTGLTGATHAGMSLKQMMADRKSRLAAARDKVEANFGKLDQATTALDSFGDDLGSEADDLLASIGQFKNDLG